ncbi:MAG: type II CAAX prenyl endopeptidase Rce1 family protein [Promethearchaeota archaeon]
MSEERKSIVKHCVYCGSKLKKGNVYCPNCGKLAITEKLSKNAIQKKKIPERPIPGEKIEFSRKCSGCGSIITSRVLEQCPICNTFLEKIPEYYKSAPRKPGFVFTKGKLQSEQKFVIKKDSWNLKEGLNVFKYSLFTYIVVQLLFIIVIFFQIGFTDSDQSSITELNINLILLMQIPGIILGIYPIWYISSHRHNFEKLGFFFDLKKILLAVIIGIIGGLLLLAINYLSSFINNFLINIGYKFFDINEYIEQENTIIKKADLIWKILLLIMVSFQAIATEIVYRGVLHNTLKERFQRNEKIILGKIKVILFVALAYAAINILFSLIIGIIFFILNLLVFILLGILYEINGNIYNTILASIFYNNLLIILIIWF